MGCNHSTTKSTFNETPFGTNDGETTSPNKKVDNTNFEEQRQYPSSEAFIVSLDASSQPVDYQSGDPSQFVAKNIPKRLQQLMQQPTTTESRTTREELEEKLAKAEQRRLEYQQQKIFAVQRVTQFKDPSSEEKAD